MRRGYDVEEVLQEFPEHYRQYIHLVPSTVHCEVRLTNRLTALSNNDTLLIINSLYYYKQYKSFSNKVITNSSCSASWVWTGYARLKCICLSVVGLRTTVKVSPPGELHRDKESDSTWAQYPIPTLQQGSHVHQEEQTLPGTHLTPRG